MKHDYSSQLKPILPKAMDTILGDRPYFAVTASGRLLTPTLVTSHEDQQTYRLGETDLLAKVKVETDGVHRVMVQTIELINSGEAPLPPLQQLSTLSVPLGLGPRGRPQLHWIGGGLTHSFYPPLAYRENTLSFGYPLPDARGRGYITTSGPDGRTSNQDLPILQVNWEIEGAPMGIWGALEWSGMWTLGLRATPPDEGGWLFSGGPQIRDLTLAPGETLSLPPTYIGFFEGDLQDGCNRARRYLYDVICPDYDGHRPLPPASYDHWFGVGERIDEAFLKRQVDACAELGLEFFVLDASWFPGAKQAFSHGVGNWERVDLEKFPNGLEPLAAYVRDKGMKFGLWFEVERGHRSSDWVKNHPNWYIDLGGEYLHLDLTQTQVQDAVIKLISDWIQRLDLRWSRWDYNIGPKPFWEKLDSTGKVQFAYLKGLYRVLDTLMQRHPQWLIECCASGGRRIDFGTLKRAHTIWFSDHSDDPHICRLMQTGAARYLPGHLTNSSIQVNLGEGDGRFQESAVLSRMAGALSFDGDVASWSPELRERFQRLVDIYREYRHLLVKDFYALTPYPRTVEDWDVIEFIDPQTTDAVILAYRVAGRTSQRVVSPRGLRSDCNYEVTLPLEGGGFTISGTQLMKEGISISLPVDRATIHRLIPSS
ncbi:alpha-galactosidase [Candidatus Poribacteria bacterium]|nr:alpha-galactosidase [Candidatus Poribacteria bacterium]